MIWLAMSMKTCVIHVEDELKTLNPVLVDHLLAYAESTIPGNPSWCTECRGDGGEAPQKVAIRDVSLTFITHDFAGSLSFASRLANLRNDNHITRQYWQGQSCAESNTHSRFRLTQTLPSPVCRFILSPRCDRFYHVIAAALQRCTQEKAPGFIPKQGLSRTMHGL
jgi:hypothetical protein